MDGNQDGDGDEARGRRRGSSTGAVEGPLWN